MPSTWMSTGRGPGHSGIWWYRLPPDQDDIILKGAPCAGVEIIQRHHRYALVFPSTVKDADADRNYDWYRPDGTRSDQPPAVSDLPVLPAEWIPHLLQTDGETGGESGGGTGGWRPGATIKMGERDNVVTSIAWREAHRQPSLDALMDYMETLVWPVIEQPPGQRFTKNQLRQKVKSAWSKKKAARKREEEAADEVLPVAEAAAKISTDILTATDKGRRLYRYDEAGGHWTTEDATDSVERAARTLYTDKHYIPHLGESVVKILLNQKAKIDPANNTWRVAFRNGTLNLTVPDDPRLEDHAPGNYLTATLPVHYDKTATCPTWHRYLKEAIEDEDQRSLLQQAVGTMLVDQIPPKGAVIWLGPPDTGKSVGLRVITALIGAENTCALSPQDFHKDKHASASLYAKKANIPSDIPVKAWEDPSVWKQLVGQDWMYGNPKFKDRFAFKSTATTLMTGNAMPKTWDRTGAVRARLFVIHGRTDIIPMAERDGQLTQKIVHELPGILNWAIDGLRVVAEKRLALEHHRRRPRRAGTAPPP